jgi:hypothetical protein
MQTGRMMMCGKSVLFLSQFLRKFAFSSSILKPSKSSPSTFQNRVFYLPGAVSNTVATVNSGFAAVTMVLSFSFFLIISAGSLKNNSKS